MSVRAFVGAQWGDEGKGKMNHLASSRNTDIDLRYSGGANAGHTIVINGATYKFRQIPGGIICGVTCVIGGGMALDPIGLKEEYDELAVRQASLGRLLVHQDTALVMPYHKLQDECSEKAKGPLAVGTTRRGIGPCYADKCFRVGIRAGEVRKPEFRERVIAAAARKNKLFRGYYDESEFDPLEMWAQLEPAIAFLQEHVCDGVAFIRSQLALKSRIVLEGAQGGLLDFDDGTYPHVTSNHPGSAGIFSGTGISWRDLDDVTGITKAYTTRVGNGPFPTEQDNDIGQMLGAIGNEVGTVTGRIRRCGWLDLPLLDYVAQLNGFTRLIVTKLDVLDALPVISVCVGHKYGGDNSSPETWPRIGELERAIPVYEDFPGWEQPTTECRFIKDLPINAQRYLGHISKSLGGLPIDMVSVGPDMHAVCV